VPDGASLTVESAAVNRDLRVIFVRHTGRCQRLSGGGAHGFNWKIGFEGAPVDDDLAGPAGEGGTSDGGLSPGSASMLGNFRLRDLYVSHFVNVKSLNRQIIPKLNLLCRGQGGRLLSGVRMFFAFIDFQLGH